MAADVDSQRPLITEVEIEATFEIPTIFCNKFYLSLSPITGRLTFAEMRTPDSKPNIRVSVTMSIGDLIEMRNLLERMLEGKTQAISLPQGDKNA